MEKYYVKAHASFLGKSGYNNHSKRFFTELNKYIDVCVRNFSMDGCTLFDGADGYKKVNVDNGIVKLDWSKDKNVTLEEQLILYEQSYFVDSSNRKDAPINNKKFDEKGRTPINIILNEVGHYYFYDIYNSPKIAYTVWESTRYPEQFFNKLLEFDQLWVPSRWQKQCTIDQGYPENKIKIVPEGVDKEFIPLKNRPKNKKFTFVIVGRWDYRKSTLEMIKAFKEVFGNNKNVKLKLLVDNLYSIDGLKTTKERLKYHNLQSDNIEILSFLNRKDYIKLLQTSDVLISCSRGEGFNLPLIEAIACGIITICSNWGAQLDFAKDVSHLVNIKGEFEVNSSKNIYNHFYISDVPGNYCEPDFEHLKEVMLDVYKNSEEYLKMSLQKSYKIREEFSWQNAAKIAYNELKELVNIMENKNENKGVKINNMNRKKILMITPHLSSGGLPQVFYKKVLNLKENYDLKVIEYSDLTAGIFVVQKNRLKEILKPEDFITLGEDKNELFKIINDFNPQYIHLEEIPEIFMSHEIAEKIYSNDRTYYITESTHDVGFNINNKKFLPDKFMHVSKYIADKYKVFDIPYEIIEYPIEEKIRPDRNESLKKLGLDPEYKHVLNVGLFTPGKNQKQIFEIARKMQSEKIQFHFVGNQAGNFQHYWRPLMENKPDNCIVWGERNDVDNFYCCMDLFLFTSTYELNPVVIKEALSWNMKILMYNLEPYNGMYDNNPNIDFLSEDDFDNINKIKNILNIKKYDYPEKCYITHTTENYVETTFGLIYSLLEYSNFPILVFTVNFDINNINNPFKFNDRVIFIKYENDFYPKGAVLFDTVDGKYVDRNIQDTYKILSIKSKIILKSFELGVKAGVYLDSDSVARYNVDDLMLETENVENYPLFTRGVYDIMLDENGKGDIERPLMNYLNVKERSMYYVQSNIVVFTDKCKDFLNEWKQICEDENVLLNFKEWAPYQDETIANVLLWKHKYTKHLPMYHFNIRNLRFVEEFEKFDDTDKSKYSEQMLGFPFYIDGVQMEWSYIPYNKEDVKVFHGIKKLDEMIDIIEYQNRIKKDFCMLQMYDSNYKELAEITKTNNKKYCDIHGYDYICYDRKIINDDKTFHWQRYPMIKRHLRNYKWLFFLDIDAMIMNYNIKLEDLIDDNYHIIMENMGDLTDVQDETNKKYCDINYNPIASAILLKNSKTVCDFLDDVYNNVLNCNINLQYDNSAVRCTIGYFNKYKKVSKMYPIDSKKLNAVWYSNKPSYILHNGPKWNDNKNFYEIGDFLIHIVAYDTEERISLLKQFVPYIIPYNKFSKIDILQIGSHVGNTINDPIFNRVNKDMKLILVEPVPYLFNELKNNYKNKLSDVSNIVFINKAVSDCVGEIELFVPSEKNDFSKFPFWASQLASINENHIKSHLNDLIVDKIKIECTTIDEIIKEYNIEEIELLHTDTEGHDYTILMGYSFKIKPKKILFEHKHMDGEFKTGEKYENLISRLKSIGYKIVYKNEEDTMLEL